MSDLRSSLLKARLTKLPPVPPWPAEPLHEDDEDDSDANYRHEQDESRDSFPGPSSSSALLPHKEKTSRRTHRNPQDFSPLTAQGYFDQALEVDVPLCQSEPVQATQSNAPHAKFRVYYTPPRPSPRHPAPSQRGPRHANAPPSGSFQDVSLSAASMAPPTVDEEYDDGGESAGPGTLFLFHHGAGFSGLSYALTAAEITRTTEGQVGVLAFDCRGHAMFPDPSQMPSLILVGHSMGGSVVVSASEQLFRSGFTRIAGVAVLDVVEGTAMDALEGMRSIVLSHPRGFDSVEQAIEWHVDSKTIANPDSARVSVPPLVERNTDVPDEVARTRQADSEPMEVLQDHEGAAAQEPGQGEEAQRFRYKWRADLLATEPYWRSWFQGLSSRFLGVKTARLLLLAGTDRLDKELMIGQMQGKYQLAVIPDVGHCLQEDAPDKTASILVDFWRRNERIKLPLKGIKKVGEA
ncbi:related to Protein phosphatase methylesterase 1 [Pseudozyma flocculosa]|uniref:Protein phosphatase methylesterase 1 n=1 Tax=Pseudozyma flocculosa TaxID=84751 RepID=A0A5C3EV09_9BASI|nr:related to Protein phosphatase methylesterase 1 [Pseudozyma flocculosa]